MALRISRATCAPSECFIAVPRACSCVSSRVYSTGFTQQVLGTYEGSCKLQGSSSRVHLQLAFSGVCKPDQPGYCFHHGAETLYIYIYIYMYTYTYIHQHTRYVWPVQIHRWASCLARCGLACVWHLLHLQCRGRSSSCIAQTLFDAFGLCIMSFSPCAAKSYLEWARHVFLKAIAYPCFDQFLVAGCDFDLYGCNSPNGRRTQNKALDTRRH